MGLKLWTHMDVDEKYIDTKFQRLQVLCADFGGHCPCMKQLWDRTYTFTNGTFHIAMSVCQEATVLERDLPLV